VASGEVDLQELKVMYEEAVKDISVICETREQRADVAKGINDGMRWHIGLVQSLRVS
jgi:hypothetical protein